MKKHPITCIRILATLMTLVLLTTAIIIPVDAAGHTHKPVDLDATYGKEATISVRGECEYAVAYEVLAIINAERKKVGKSALVMDKAMMEAAMLRAAECSVYYDHTRPNGENCFTAFPELTSAGENIAAGYIDAESVMADWMASPGHKSNILDEGNYGFRTIGIGVFKIDGIYYWSQLFNGTAKKSTPTQKKAITKTFTIKVRPKLLDLSINKDKLSLKDGESAALTVTNRNLGFPYYDHPIGGLTFTSDNDKIASVSSDGVVSSTGDGTTTIRIYSGDKKALLFSVKVTAKCNTLTASASHTVGKTNVVWNNVTGASQYEVCKSTYQNGKWSPYKVIARIKTTSYTDTATSGAKVKYCIYAHDGTQRMNAYDSVITMYLAQPTAKAANTASGVKVSWNKVTGATTYKVYRSLYSGGKWTSYKAYKTTKTTSWTDTSVKAGQKARYTVYAYNGSYKSTEKAGVSIVFLTQPKVKVANAASGVKISWGKITGAKSYKVYKSEYKSGKWTAYTAVKVTTVSSWTDSKVKSGQKVRYTVYAYNDSYKSAEKTGVSTTYLSQPKVKLTKATKGVKVSWGKVTGATTYKVYRSVYRNGKWSAYTAYKTTKNTSYTDTSVNSKQKVRYTVYAYNGSYKSAEKTGVSITR